MNHRRFTFLPWDLNSWRTAFAWSGTSGLAMLALLLAGFFQLPDTQGDIASAGHASSATIWLFRAPLTFIAALLMLARPAFPELGLRDLRFWYLLYTAYFALSMLWSTSALATAGKAFELILAILIILGASTGVEGLHKLEALYRLTLLLASSLALVTVVGFLAGSPYFVANKPGIFTAHTAASPFYSANGLGVLAIGLLLVAFAEWQLTGARLVTVAPQALYAAAIFTVSSSRTSLAVLLLGLCAVLLYKSKALLLTFVLAAGAVLWSLEPQIVARLRENQSQGNIDTLSGRTVMWSAALREWVIRPCLGYGGGVGGKYVLAHLGNSSLAKMTSLHNGFLECLTGLGIAGLLLTVAILAATTFRTFHVWRHYPQFSGQYIWIISLWIVSIMGVGALGWLDYLVVIYMLLIAHTDILCKQELRACATARVTGGILELSTRQCL